MNASRTATDWVAVVPVKERHLAKMRLQPSHGSWRAELAGAFALDTLGAICACPLIASVIIVTGDVDLAEQAADPKLQATGDRANGDDLNLAISDGARVASRCGASRLVVLTADLPALRPVELQDALVAAQPYDSAVVSDVENTGTTMLSASSPELLHPRFGVDSFARHKAAGAVALEGQSWPGLRRDVDLPEQLAEVAMLVPGPRTAALLERIGLA